MNKYVTRFVSFVSIMSLFVPTAFTFAEESTPPSNETSTTISAVTTPDTTVQQVTPVDTTITTETTESSSSSTPTTESTSTPPIAEEAPQAEATATDPDPDPAPQNQQQSETKLKVETDKATGALRYEYPIDLPKGRNNLTPTLSLKYNSQNTDNSSITGYGWETSIPYIKRLNKYGVDKLYDGATETFISSIDGELTLVDPLLHTYRPTKDGGDFHVYTYTNNAWSVTDKSGTTYAFGTTPQSRQDDPSDPNRVYQWNIETVTDTNTNTINYTYTKDQGQIYPSIISYADIFSIHFDLQTSPSPRTSAIYGFMTTTEKRISEIRIETNNVWKKKYTLNYTTADNGQEVLLASVTEAGQDAQGTVITRSPMTFEYTKSTPGWTYDPTFSATVPLTFNGDNSEDEGVRTADINGDGLVDFIKSLKNAYGVPVAEIYLNTGSGWQNVSSTWSFPPDQQYFIPSASSNRIETFVERSTTSGPYKPRDLQFMDVNGDGLSDLVRARSYASNNYKYVYLNNGSGWTYDATFSATIPFTFTGNGGDDEGVRTADINGDGLIDFVRSAKSSFGNYPAEIYLNTGTGWQNTSNTWAFPLDQQYLVGNPLSNRVETFVERSSSSNPYKSRDLQFMDVNGDGLNDLIRSRYHSSNNFHYVYLNNGSGWTYDATFSATIPFTFTGNGGDDEGVRTADINGDGLVDFVKSSKTSGYWNNPSEIYLNTGTGWQNTSSTWSFPVDQQYIGNPINPRVETFSETTSSAPPKPRDLQFMDVNGDGLNDLIRSRHYGSNNYQYVYINSTSTQNLLSKITPPSGSETTVTYKSTPQFVSTPGTLLNPHVSSSRDIVSTITTTDPVSTLSSRLEYTYSGGEHFYAGPHDKEFAGFEKVEESLYDSATGGTLKKKVTSYYHQGDADNTMPITNPSQSSIGETTDTRSKMGRPFRTEVYDGSNHLLQTDITRWASTQIAGASYFVYPLTTLSQTFDPSGTHKDTGHTYTYNTTTGDITVDTSHGFVTGNTDGTYTDTGTDTKTVAYSYVTNPITGVDTVKQILVTNSSGTTVQHEQYAFDGLGYGNVTKGNKTKIATLMTGSTYAYQYSTYNPYGMPLTTKDPNGNITSYTYDTNNLYPATTTNPLGYITTFVYDPTLGKPTKVTEVNGNVSEYTYDGLGRLLTSTGSDSAGTMVSLESFTYDDTPLHSFITHNTSLTDTLINTSISYLDSFGREIQRATKQGSQAIKTDTIYSPIGLVEKKSFPYTDTTTLRTPAQSNTAYYTTMTYDALGRVLTETTVSGTNTHTYTPYTESVIDREGHQKDYTVDAYVNLISVVEYISTTPYTTVYQYDANNNLTKVTDALGNIRTFTYDTKGHRLSATDLHAPTDSTFGTYSHTYDLNGNMLTMTLPGGTVVSYQYNTLNQQIKEDSSSTPSIVDIAYTYNTCLYGKGLLCSATRMVEVTPGTVVPQTTTYIYDKPGNRTSETIAYGTGLPVLTTVSTYTRQHQVITQKNPDSITLTYTYNDQGQVSKIEKTISGVTTPVITSATYAPTGALASIVYPNTITLTNTYDPLAEYRLTSKNAIRGTVYVQKLAYTYTPMGNIASIIDTSNTGTAKTTTFVYDDLYRLTKATATVPAGTQLFNEIYTYDILGNITTKNGTTYKYLGNTGTLTANPHAATQIGAQNRTYDILGNVIADGVHTNLFNYRNELRTMTKAGTQSRYTYDHTGGRVSDITGTKVTYTPTKSYTQDRTGGALSKQTTTVYVGDAQVAFFDTVGTNVTPNYVMTDHLGSTEKVTNQAGTLTSITDYYPYGKERTQTGPQPKRAFIGEQYDTASDYNYLNARYYHGDQGQFISQDSMFWQLPKELLKDPQQQNSYSYARNNPIMQKDPSGKCIWDVCIVEALAVGAAVGALIGYFGNPKIANAPAENSQVYASPSESEINTNIAISTYTGSMTFGAAALELNAMKPAIVGKGQSAISTSTQEAPQLNAPNNLYVGNAKVIFKNDNVQLSKHAVDQMAERQITVQQVENTMKNKSFSYTQTDGTKMNGYHDSRNQLFVAQVKETGVVRTVINNVTSNYVNNVASRQ